jgi:hypothetical protein
VEPSFSASERWWVPGSSLSLARQAPSPVRPYGSPSSSPGYDLRHSFASLLIHEGRHSIVQIAEWMGHSPATLLTHYAHVIADVTGKSTLPSEQAIKAARGTQPPYTPNNSTTGNGHRVVTQWRYS